MSRRGITKQEKNLIKSALLYGAYGRTTWGDICKEKEKEEKILDNEKGK